MPGEGGSLCREARKEYGGSGVGNWESGLQGCVTRGRVGCRNKGLIL